MKKFGLFLVTIMTAFFIIAITLPINASENYTISVNSPLSHIGVGDITSVNATVSPSSFTVTWRSEDESIATVSGSGSVTGVSAGTVTITGSCTDPTDGSIITDSTTITVFDSDGIVDNTAYYVMNAFSSKYMSLQSLSDANNVNVATAARSTSTASQWTVSLQSNGTYRLINKYSSTGRALYRSGSNLVINSSTSNSSRFYILRMDSGNHQGQYLIKSGSKFISQDTSGNVCLVNEADISALSYWSFMPAVQGFADLTSTCYSGFINSATKY